MTKNINSVLSGKFPIIETITPMGMACLIGMAKSTDWSTYPMNMKRKRAAVMRAPRLAGDNIPNMANTETDNQTCQTSYKLHQMNGVLGNNSALWGYTGSETTWANEWDESYRLHDNNTSITFPVTDLVSVKSYWNKDLTKLIPMPIKDVIGEYCASVTIPYYTYQWQWVWPRKAGCLHQQERPAV